MAYLLMPSKGHLPCWKCNKENTCRFHKIFNPIKHFLFIAYVFYDIMTYYKIEMIFVIIKLQYVSAYKFCLSVFFYRKNWYKAQRKAKFYINKCRSASCMQGGLKQASA